VLILSFSVFENLKAVFSISPYEKTTSRLMIG
jgi:hypothetical protein